MSSPTSALGVMAPRCAPRAVGHSCTVVHCQCAKQTAWPACKEVAACRSQTDFWDCLIPRLSGRGVGERADNTHGAGWPAAVTSQKRNAPHHQRRDGGLRGGAQHMPGVPPCPWRALTGQRPAKKTPNPTALWSKSAAPERQKQAPAPWDWSSGAQSHARRRRAHRETVSALEQQQQPRAAHAMPSSSSHFFRPPPYARTPAFNACRCCCRRRQP